MATTRIALLTEIPAPFRIPLFNALAAQSGTELEVLFLSEQDPKRPYPLYTEEFRFSWRVLRSRQLVRDGRWIVFSRGVLGALRAFRPTTIVIGGWNQPAFWVAALYARLARVQLLAWIESTSRDARPGSAMTELPKLVLIRLCTGFIVPGRASAEYLGALGVAPGRVTVAPNAVDLTIFRDRVAEARESRDELRAQLGLAGSTVIVVARLDREKGVDILIEAVQGLDTTLVVIGAGPEEAALRAAAGPNVRFVGRIDRDELVQWYATADVFVLPSRSDQWGMVLNEAAAAGLPVIASEAPGAGYDLIDPGVNGFRVPTGNAPALRTALDCLLRDPEFLTRASARSLELAEPHTPEAWALAVAASCSGRQRW